MATHFVTSRSDGPSVDGKPTGRDQFVTRSRGASALGVVPIMVDGLRGVAVSGDLDPEVVSLLDTTVAEACRTDLASQDPGAKPGFLLDLREVTFLDASSLFMLGRILEQIDGYGNELRVTVPRPAGPRRVLLLAVLRGVLPAVFSPWSS